MPTRPILFYDGQCPLCRKEIAHYQRLDRRQRVDWQDLFIPESSPERYGLDRIQAMRVIHAVDRQGQLQTGVHAFMVIWRELPYYRHLASVIDRLRLTRPLDWAYHRFAVWRFRSRCKQGCKLPPVKRVSGL